MDVWEHGGRKFEVVMASDLDRDGMALELTDLADAPGVGPVLEAFWHDSAPGFDFIVHRPTVVPLPVIERFVNEASRLLPPVQQR
ncbi:hypothetical protein [Nocardioides acrostichi]|uniref:Uncharacterized protein n=1 Tax=Nocardioides acrostichi TaxID=2784339 RepID=A0A930V3K7_9ACTN|nr:hypothetical protein [Nocardioides acrostichi]MBF4162589.1 hypothetical protein [Nocardioides acrostichi]